LISQAVVDAARDWTETRARGGYTVQQMFAKADEARKLFAGMVGAGEDEIGFVSSTTDGENLVVNSLEFKAGDNVVFDDLVYPSTPIIYQRLADTQGVEVRVVQKSQRRRAGRGLREASERPHPAGVGGVGFQQQRLSPRS
jgi:selenocysteine lyase/cysteine desulfurase